MVKKRKGESIAKHSRRENWNVTLATVGDSNSISSNNIIFKWGVPISKKWQIVNEWIRIVIAAWNRVFMRMCCTKVSEWVRQKAYTNCVHNFECVLYVNICSMLNFAHVSNDDCYHKYYTTFFFIISRSIFPIFFSFYRFQFSR